MENNLEYLKSRLDYCPDSGKFYWKMKESSKRNNQWNARFAGKEAGCKQKHGDLTYVSIRIDGKLYLAHRLAWQFIYGEVPNIIDHIDQNSLNNDISNLRNSDKENNGRNCKLSKNNSSGVNGVYWHKQNQRWAAEGHYTENGINKKVSLGTYTTLEEASAARKQWELSQGNFSELHGRCKNVKSENH